MRLGLVFNSTNVDQYIGSHCVPAKAYGRIPVEHLKWLRDNPNSEMIPVDGNPEREICRRTLHRPFGARYQS